MGPHPIGLGGVEFGIVLVDLGEDRLSAIGETIHDVPEGVVSDRAADGAEHTDVRPFSLQLLDHHPVREITQVPVEAFEDCG